jgi:hypothetical protein
VWLQKNNGNLPTVEEIENVWDIPEEPEIDEDEDDPEEALKELQNTPEYRKYVLAIKVLLWWVDAFLPMAVGLEYWGPNNHPFHLMTDKTLVDGDNSGKEKCQVTVTSEAFAHLLFANSHDKWMADFAYFKNNPKAKKVPIYKKDDPSTFPHQNKWSNSNTGQVQGGGWRNEGLEYFNQKMDEVKQFRALEEKAGNVRYLLAQKLICEENQVNLEEDTAHQVGKKRKRDGADKSREVVDLIFLDQ